MLDSSYQGVKRLFTLAYYNTEGDNQVSVDSHQKYFLPRVNIASYNIEIDGRNFCDQPINDLIKQYEKVRKVSKRRGDDYTTGCLLDFAYFSKKKKKYRLIAADLSKEKALDPDSRAIQWITFTGTVKTTAIIYCNLEQSYNFLKEQQKFCN